MRSAVCKQFDTYIGISLSNVKLRMILLLISNVTFEYAPFEFHIEYYPSAAIYDPQMSLKYALLANGCNEPRYGPANPRFGENCKKLPKFGTKFRQKWAKCDQKRPK